MIMVKLITLFYNNIAKCVITNDLIAYAWEKVTEENQVYVVIQSLRKGWSLTDK